MRSCGGCWNVNRGQDQVFQLFQHLQLRSVEVNIRSSSAFNIFNSGHQRSILGLLVLSTYSSQVCRGQYQVFQPFQHIQIRSVEVNIRSSSPFIIFNLGQQMLILDLLALSTYSNQVSRGQYQVFQPFQHIQIRSVEVNIRSSSPFYIFKSGQQRLILGLLALSTYSNQVSRG